MIPAEYNAELSATIYQDVKFSIDGDQLVSEVQGVDCRAWGWHAEESDARAYAQEIADKAQQDIEVAAYGFWGIYGKEYIECFKVAPSP